VKNPRDYGYGESPAPVGPPVVGERCHEACPNCGCTTVFVIKVTLPTAPPQLRRPKEPHTIVGNYVGCPACPWASPMITICVVSPD